jgi:CheY-like chemotaxis protein
VKIHPGRNLRTPCATGRSKYAAWEFQNRSETVILIISTQGYNDNMSEEFAIKKSLVLIIEDNEDFQNLYGLVAEQAGFEAESIIDGAEALQRLEHGPLPTLILLDTHLPMVGGDEILQTARANKQWSAVPIYVLTADVRAAQAYRHFLPGAPHPDGVIEKGAESIHQLRELFAKYKE